MIKSTEIQIRINISLLNRAGILFILTIFLNYSSFSQGRIWFSELGVSIKKEQKVQYTDGSFSTSPEYGYFANINNGGKRIAVGLQMDYSPVDLKNVNAQEVKKNSLRLWEFYLTLRYYPMLPTLRFWTSGAIRFTAGGSIGGYSFYWRENDTYSYPSYSHLVWSPLSASSVVFAGLCFSSFRNTTGLSIKLNYKPQTYKIQNFPLKNFTLNQNFSLSAALLIGPKIKT